MAIVRVAAVANEGGSPSTDKAFLYHRGSALTKLRAKLLQPAVLHGDEDLAAITTLLCADVGSLDQMLGVLKLTSTVSNK